MSRSSTRSRSQRTMLGIKSFCNFVRSLGVSNVGIFGIFAEKSAHFKLRSKVKDATFELYLGIIRLQSSRLTHRQVEIILLLQNL